MKIWNHKQIKNNLHMIAMYQRAEQKDPASTCSDILMLDLLKLGGGGGGGAKEASGISFG